MQLAALGVDNSTSFPPRDSASPMKYLFQFTVALFCCWLTVSVSAQERGGRGEGGFGRGRGGGPGGGRGGFGGDRGGRSGPGGFGRGPGGGGPGGGPGRFGGRGGGPGGGPGGFGGPGGGPGGPGGRRGGGLDANGDGIIDRAEIEQIPEDRRAIMRERGISIRPGTSVDEFHATLERQREIDGGVENFRNGGPGQRFSNNRPQPIAPYRQSDKERVTIDLPPRYSDLDTDFDGQVGMYEWMTVRRESLDQFDEIDTNLDGILTPRELKAFDDASASTEAKVTKYERERITIVGGSGSRNDSPGSAGRGRFGGNDDRRNDRRDESDRPDERRR